MRGGAPIAQNDVYSGPFMNSTNDATAAPRQPAITCASCKACCCKLEVMLIGDEDIPPALTEVDAWGGLIMKRLDDGWCAALDRKTHRCGIYAIRPVICRDYAAGDHDCLDERARGGL